MTDCRNNSIISVVCQKITNVDYLELSCVPLIAEFEDPGGSMS
jgi:hypothetical protein